MEYHRHQVLRLWLVVLSVVATAVQSSAGEVLSHLPREAMGFITVRNIGRADARVASLLQKLELPFPAPLALLQATTGLGAGIDSDGDLLIALLPTPKPMDRPPMAVWLPTDDYEQFLASLQASSDDRITAVTVAGEDLLVAKQDDWALLMDPSERARMERMLDSPTSAKLVAADWHEWTKANDVTAAILPPGIRTITSWAMVAPDDGGQQGESLPDGQPDDLERTFIEGVALDSSASTALRNTIRRWVRETPKFMLWAMHTDAIACGVRLDETGSAVVGGRWLWRDGPGITLSAARADAAPAPMPRLAPDSDFIAVGAGVFPREITVEGASMYARWLVRGLEHDSRARLDDVASKQFVMAMRAAAEEVESLSVLTRPGAETDGVYTNSFLAARVSSSEAFIERAQEVMRTWNELNVDLEGEMKLVFDSKSLEIAGRNATEYSIDMANAVGTPALPEVRQAMEKLFGPEGKMRLVICPIDAHSVLMATGTPDQAKTMLATLTEAPSASGEWPGIGPTSQLLPAQSSWQMFVSPHGYTSWLRRQMDAVLGPVLGGPIIKAFPASPPVGIVGGFADHQAWVDVALPNDTIRAAADYLRK